MIVAVVDFPWEPERSSPVPVAAAAVALIAPAVVAPEKKVVVVEALMMAVAFAPW